MRLQSLKPNKGATKNRKRVGRGQGSGWGCTSGKGNKGQKSRSGYAKRPWFEGGQMPLQRRVPKRGFTNIHAKPAEEVKLGDLEGLTGEKITPALLKERGLIRNAKSRVKVLGNGEVTGPLTLRAHGVSASARTKIEAAGGTVELIAPPRKFRRLRKKSERPQVSRES